MPVFSLKAQEGRLFKPLAFTKTFSMFFASFLGVTLVPVLMVLLDPRQDHAGDEKSGQPLSDLGLPAVRALRAALSLVHARRCALVILALHDFSVQQARQRIHAAAERRRRSLHADRGARHVDHRSDQILQMQDRQLKKFPRSMTVFGKAGQAETPTDPAPLDVRNGRQLKPPNEWRPG